MSTIYKNYDTTLDNLKDFINTYGVATIPNVISQEELESLRNDLWDVLAHLTQNMETPISRDDPSSWKTYFNLHPNKGMLLQHWGIGHSQLAWNIRQNPNVATPFSKLWGVENNELLTSFDGMSWQPKPEITNKRMVRSWFHVDQSFTKKGLKCYQGQVLLYDVEEGDATLRILEKSHNYHEDFGKKFNKTDKSDWYKLESKSQEEFYKEKGCEDHCVLAKAGSLILWDSRTIHQGQVAFPNRQNPKNRAVVYVCMTPRSWASPKDISKKIKAFEELRSTTHWPHKVKLFPKFPQTYGNPLPNVNAMPIPQLSELGIKLAGY